MKIQRLFFGPRRGGAACFGPRRRGPAKGQRIGPPFLRRPLTFAMRPETLSERRVSRPPCLHRVFSGPLQGREGMEHSQEEAGRHQELGWFLIPPGEDAGLTVSGGKDDVNGERPPFLPSPIPSTAPASAPPQKQIPSSPSPSCHVIPLRVGIDAELDRVVGFGRGCFVCYHNGCQFGGFHPHLTTHVI
jgi:hypothetical protein